MFPRVSSSRTASSSWCATRLAVLPEVLDARALQEAVDPLDCRLAERPAIGPARPWRFGREPLLEHLLRIGVRVELVDDVDRERHAHLVVLEELELVSTQASVSSAWRLTQTVSEPTRMTSVPSAKSTQARIERVRGLTRGS